MIKLSRLIGEMIGISCVFDLSRCWIPNDGFGPNAALADIYKLPGVYDIEKCPLADGFRETYHYRILFNKNAKGKIDNIINFYSQQGKRYRIRITPYSYIERFKTGGHYFVVVVGSMDASELIKDISNIWEQSGWQAVKFWVAGGWANAIGCRPR